MGIMHSKKGFTLIEMMIVIAIIGILVSVAIPAYQNRNLPPEERRVECVGGYKFVSGTHTQIIDRDGKGIPCSIGPSGLAR